MADQPDHTAAPEKVLASEVTSAPAEAAPLSATAEDPKLQETAEVAPVSGAGGDATTEESALVVTAAEDTKPNETAEAAPITASGGPKAEDPIPVVAAAKDPKPQETTEAAPVSVAAGEMKSQETSPAAGAAEDPEPDEYIEDIPDPDEDDLDDLDDMLEEFSAAKLGPGTKGPTAAAPGPSISESAPAAAATAAEDGFSDEEFAKQLQAGMADLLGEMETSPEMKAQFEQFENIFKELGAADVAAGSQASGAGGGASSQGAKGASSSFQDNIRRTMERMQASGESATAAATADSQAADDLLAEMLKSMNSGGGGLGEGSEEDFSKMLLGMMEQLTNKEILYEPMKELNEKYPEWLEKNKATISAEDLARYKEQHRLAGEIVAKFEEKSYADSNAADREYIVDRMQKMQAEGSPPSDLVGDMPSAQEALGGPDDEACNPQ
ncbi:hypothetical protein MAPG_05572 [Magnaporthiopsis poae ATCC 64411]|uniref:Uncharacterized protein n=1 Tax=Magnaporthiopsis poae (strain ATCC 64411 / 73-15) TaxID=644358 RepID=A0A0C4DZR6_MAGP6|nr:hypothetical protein MAPG_05572 [Magnaporthiopsis poae ATCC 64411]